MKMRLRLQFPVSVAADGTLTARAADGRASNVVLSPESAAIARELAALSAASASPGTTAGQILPTFAVKISG